MDLGAEALVLLDGVLDDGGDAAIQSGPEVFLGQADPESFDIVVERVDIIRHRNVGAGGVALIEAGHLVEDEGGVGGGAGHDAGLVERGGEGDHAPARDSARRWA